MCLFHSCVTQYDLYEVFNIILIRRFVINELETKKNSHNIFGRGNLYD